MLVASGVMAAPMKPCPITSAWPSLRQDLDRPNQPPIDVQVIYRSATSHPVAVVVVVMMVMMSPPEEVMSIRMAMVEGIRALKIMFGKQGKISVAGHPLTGVEVWMVIQPEPSARP